MREYLYNREKAVAYAHKWAYLRNPSYYDYQNIGGDCTNFASQCIYSSCGVMNYTPVYGWYYKNGNDKTPSWTGVNFLYDFLINNQGIGPFAKVVDIHEALPGDIAQLSFSGDSFHHSPVIVSINGLPSHENILIAAHTFNADNRPLSTYSFDRVRFLHILGYRK